MRLVLVLPLIGAGLLAAACDSRSPAPAPAAPQVMPSARPGVPALTDVQTRQIEAAFTRARALVDQARRHREAGEAAARGGGIQDAIPHYQEAVPLYREANQIVEEWIVEDFEQVTRAQIDGYLQRYVREVATWQKERERMGKVPPRD